MADASVLGRPLWYELITSDVKAAEAFYTSVLEWGLVPLEGSPQRYDMWMREGDEAVAVGGVMAMPAGLNLPPHWGMYIGVPNLEEAVAKIERLGGSAVADAIAVPSIGRMRTMRDPQRAVFSVYEPASSPNPEAPPEIGDISWLELQTTDAAAALTFYTEVFGWKAGDAIDMGPMGKYHEFGRTSLLGGMMNKGPEMAQMPPHWGLYIRVPDVDEGAELVKANGGRILNGPMDVPGGDRVVNCMDPQGAAFSLHQKKK
jgi:predicted enzyme related to lactoylglutathione lyase